MVTKRLDGRLDGRLVADRLFEWRDASGWNQVELAQRAAISPTTVTTLENARIEHPRLNTVRKLARAFGVSVEEFLYSGSGDGGEIRKEEDTDASLATRLQALAPEHQNTLIELTGDRWPEQGGGVTALGQLRHALFQELHIGEAEFADWLLSATPAETAAMLGLPAEPEEGTALRYVGLLELFGGARDKVLRRIAEVTRPFAPGPT